MVRFSCVFPSREGVGGNGPELPQHRRSLRVCATIICLDDRSLGCGREPNPAATGFFGNADICRARSHSFPQAVGAVHVPVVLCCLGWLCSRSPARRFGAGSRSSETPEHRPYAKRVATPPRTKIQTGRIYFAAQHFEHNRCMVLRKGNYALGMTMVFGAEVLCLIAWWLIG